ncbi:hypothetical protein, partial [Stenotrophomonas maltophilia]|uniref:hypothetical protein n=1 Tax=Stenotrophomonas maltophilia TaxID=40324 RepID=UPI0021C9956A
LTLANFPVTDGKGIVVIGWGKKGQIPFPAEKGSDPGSNRLLPLLLLFPFFDLPWLARTETFRGRAGWAAQGREPHGCGDRAYMDVLAASPAWPTPPGHARLLLS